MSTDLEDHNGGDAIDEIFARARELDPEAWAARDRLWQERGVNPDRLDQVPRNAAERRMSDLDLPPQRSSAGLGRLRIETGTGGTSTGAGGVAGGAAIPADLCAGAVRFNARWRPLTPSSSPIRYRNHES